MIIICILGLNWEISELNRIFNQFTHIMAKCGNILGVKSRNKRMRILQAFELKKETSKFHLKAQIISKSHMWKIEVFKHLNFPLI